MQSFQFFDRDISWLSFNSRILMEASRETVPLLERIKFLSIFSSNLDEFYRVRMPALLALQKLKNRTRLHVADQTKILQNAQEIIRDQQIEFGRIFERQIIPTLKNNGIHLLFNEAIPVFLKAQSQNLFFSQILPFLQPVYLADGKTFFPENNKLYTVALLAKNATEDIAIVNIPADQLERFLLVEVAETKYILFIEDIIRDNLHMVFKQAEIKGCYNIKITRDAELDLEDEYRGDLAEEIEMQIAKRDLGLATRFLHGPGMPEKVVSALIKAFDLPEATTVAGGIYHNLKDLASFPVKDRALLYDSWPSIEHPSAVEKSLLNNISEKDILINPPYQSYNIILRFLSEASIDADVEEIYISLYRVADNSKVVNALISAARNGKKVFVFVELKARFDEANNIKWSKKMKASGVRIVYSIPALKVHAKVALVKRRVGHRMKYYGLLATGNFNESTARFYTDHVLMTAHKGILTELELLFIFLASRRLPSPLEPIPFNHLLVSGFNLLQRFIDLIDREIRNAKNSQPANISIKLNNLEETVLISKLYEASNAGVKINIIARSICCLIPGVPGMSENIKVKRIIDKYLEHGRVFVFCNNGDPEVFMGSSDWMNRNIYRRIEVCFPLFDPESKQQILEMMDVQWKDNTQAAMIDNELNNQMVKTDAMPIRSQKCIYEMLAKNPQQTSTVI